MKVLKVLNFTKKNEDVSSDTLTYRGSWPEETEIEVSGRSSCAGAVYRTEHLPYKIRWSFLHFLVKFLLNKSIQLTPYKEGLNQTRYSRHKMVDQWRMWFIFGNGENRREPDWFRSGRLDRDRSKPGSIISSLQIAFASLYPNSELPSPFPFRNLLTEVVHLSKTAVPVLSSSLGRGSFASYPF